jgi:iron complex transport system substrate-binding protein
LAFPGTDYVSSEETRKELRQEKLRSWKNENLNTEVLIDMKPDVIVGF